MPYTIDDVRSLVKAIRESKLELSSSEQFSLSALEKVDGALALDHLEIYCLVLVDALARQGVPVRTHARKAIESFKSRYAHINDDVSDLTSAWQEAASLDDGLPRVAPKVSPEVTRALVGLVRRIRELEYEWS